MSWLLRVCVCVFLCKILKLSMDDVKWSLRTISELSSVPPDTSTDPATVAGDTGESCNNNNNNETCVKCEPPAQNQSSACCTENN